MSLAGRTYFEHGQPVTVLVQWTPPLANVGQPWPLVTTRPTAPRNVLIQRADGTRVVRPFRGLRRPPTTTGGASDGT